MGGKYPKVPLWTLTVAESENPSSGFDSARLPVAGVVAVRVGRSGSR